MNKISGKQIIKKHKNKEKQERQHQNKNQNTRHRVNASEIELHKGHSYVIRLLEVPEVMRCIGWDDSYFAGSSVERDLDFGGANASGIEDLDFWCNVAGNSYSIWHYLPWWAALLGTFGKFVNHTPTAISDLDITLAEIDELEDSD